MTILITGASSGIGKELALYYAKPGTFLALTGRDQKRLQEVTEQCQAKGAEVFNKVCEVQNEILMRKFILEVDAISPLDLVFANAGISNAGRPTSEKNDREIFAINLEGVLNTFYPALELMRKRHCGQIAIISSIAAFISMPRSPAYCASKAAVKVFGEAMRGKLKREGIKVSVVCPGFIETPMTKNNHYPMPFLMTPERAVKIMVKGLMKNRGLIVFPWRMYFALWFLRLVPVRVVEKIMENFL